MEAKKVRPTAHDIQMRFFEAVDMLIESKRLKGLKTFCETYGLHRAKYSNIRTHIKDETKKGTGYKLIDIDALSYLVVEYNVSADWLLRGHGGMFSR